MGKGKSIRRLYCNRCQHRFSERQGSLMECTKLPEPAVVRIVKCLGHGCSVEAAADICEVDPRGGTGARTPARGPMNSTTSNWSDCRSRLRRLNSTKLHRRVARTRQKRGSWPGREWAAAPRRPSRPGSGLDSRGPGEPIAFPAIEHFDWATLETAAELVASVAMLCCVGGVLLHPLLLLIGQPSALSQGDPAGLWPDPPSPAAAWAWPIEIPGLDLRRRWSAWWKKSAALPASAEGAALQAIVRKQEANRSALIRKLKLGRQINTAHVERLNDGALQQAHELTRAPAARRSWPKHCDARCGCGATCTTGSTRTVRSTTARRQWRLAWPPNRGACRVMFGASSMSARCYNRFAPNSGICY